MPLPSVFQGVQDCRLPALKPPKHFQPSRRPARQQLWQLKRFRRPPRQQLCHLFFRGFKTAVCPASNPPNASAGLQGNNSYSYYMPLPSVFQGVQDCRLPALKPPKRFCRPPRQQLLQLHAPAICFSGGLRLPFARPQSPQTLPTLPQASKATTLTATCPCHLFFRGFKTAVCLASNPPNASNPPAGLQGNNSYSYYMPLPSVFQGVQDCRLPALKPPKPFRTPPRQQLLQLHAPAICFSGGSRLPFARPLNPLKNRWQGHVVAVRVVALEACGRVGSVWGVWGQANGSLEPPEKQMAGACSCKSCCLGGLREGWKRLGGLRAGKRQSKPPKRFQPFRRPPRQQLLQLHAPAICFSGGSRLPFARPQTPQTLPQASKATTLTAQLHAPAICFSRGSRLPFARPQTPQTLPQASKATTLTATCPCHLFFRGFKTAVCPASNPPNASNPSAGLQGNNSYSYSYMPLPSVFQGVQDCRLPALKSPKRFRRPPRQQLLQLHAPAICISGGSRLPFARPQSPQTLPTLPQASKATTLTATTCPCHLFFRGFKTAVCPPSNPPNASNPPAGLQGNNSYSYMPPPSVFQGVQDCRLPALKPPKRFRRPPRQQLSQLHAPAICFSGGSRLPFARLKPPKPFRRPPRQQLLQLHAPAICFSGGSRLPFARPLNPLKNRWQGHVAVRVVALEACGSVWGVWGRAQPFRRPPRQQLLQLHAPAICFSGGSRLPFARPQTPQTLPQASKATTLTATCPCHLFFRGFKTAVCPPSNPPNPSAGLQGNNSYSYMPLPSVFQGVQDCRLPALKPPKRFQPFRRPPRQQLLQLHAPAICFSGGSRLPFARPQTPQTLPTLPQASKATTLTATTCPCHLFFRGFKTAVCPPSNPPNASNSSAGLQGNNSYSYMPLPSVFQGVQDCRLLALKPPKRFQPSPQASKATTLTATCSLPSVFQGVQDCRLPGLKSPKRFQPSRRPPRQQLLQLHAPAICFSGGSRLPFARPQTLQTLPQASKATTLTATWPCHLFFRGFKTAVCPASNPPNASAGLQGNNCYSYMPLPSVFQGVHGLQEPVIHRLLWGFCCGTNHFCFLAWFPSRRVMVDVNLPKRTAWPHNSLTHRARVGMAPRLSADMALLHIKLVAAYAPMVYLPRFGVTWRFPIAKWAYVHVSFCHCADTALLHIKSIAANAPMVYSPRSGVAYSLPVAKWAHVNISFVHYACVLHAKSVPASAAMIYLTCTHRARHGFTTVRTLVFAQLSFLRCFSFLCWHRCLVAGLGVFLLFSLQVWLPFSGLVCSIFVFLCSSLCVLCFGVVHVSFPLFFCARFPHLRTGHFCFIVLSALCCLRLCLLRRAVLFSLPFSFRDGSPDISDGTCLFLFRCFHRYFRLRCCDPLHRFADAPAGNGAFPAVAADLVTITRNDAAPAMIQKRTLLAAPCRRCISTSPRLYANNPNTLYRPCVLVSTPRQKISFRPCASCTHYTHVSVRTSYKYDKMWLVALHVSALNASSCFQAVQAMHCHGCCASACLRMLAFVKNVKKNNADWFRFNPWSDLQATVKQECTLRTTQFMRCLLIMSCREWFVTNSFGLFCGASCGFLRYLSTEFNVDVW